MNTTDTETSNEQRTPHTSPMPADLTRAVESLMSRMSSLSTVYQAETEALQQADTRGFVAIQDQKMQEAMNYEMDMQALIQRKDGISTMDPSLKEKLKALQEEFSVLVNDNAMALSRMQNTTHRLNGLIMKANRKAVHNEMAVNYGSSGRLLTEDRKRISTGRVSKNA